MLPRLSARVCRPGLLHALLAGSAMLGGCATPYLHDPAVETQAAAVKESYGKISDEAYFTELKTAYASLQTQEDAARTESLLATRDRQLTRAIKPTDVTAVLNRDSVRGPEVIQKEAAARLSELLDGPCDAGQCLNRTSDQLRSLSELPAVIRGLRNLVAVEQDTVTSSLKRFLAERDEWRKGVEEAWLQALPEAANAKGDIATKGGPPQPKV